jgi:hypothetical protein
LVSTGRTLHAAYDQFISRLDEDKLEQLQRWGAGLVNAEDQELRATGKAILLLIEEIEALHVELWTAKTAVAVVDDTDDEAAGDEEVSLDRTLGSRLRRLRLRSGGDRTESFPQAE